MQRGLSATYPAPISTIFEITDVNRFPHAYTGQKTFQFLRNSPKYGTLGRVFVIELQLKRNTLEYRILGWFGTWKTPA